MYFVWHLPTKCVLGYTLLPHHSAAFPASRDIRPTLEYGRHPPFFEWTGPSEDDFFMDGKSQRLQLYTYRQSKDVFQRHAAVLELGADIEVAGTDFVEQCDAFSILAAIAGYLPCDALAESDVQAELGGHELIVFVWIAVGLALPELMPIDRVHVEAGGERT